MTMRSFEIRTVSSTLGEPLHRGPLSMAIALAVPASAETSTVMARRPDGERTETVSARGAEAMVTAE